MDQVGVLEISFPFMDFEGSYKTCRRGSLLKKHGSNPNAYPSVEKLILISAVD